MKHTPGPWWAGHMTDAHHPCSCRSILSEGYMGSIARVSKRATDENGCNDSPPEDEAIANALLIAAAPELANALDNLVMAVDLPGDHCEIPGALEQAKTALAKVRGGINK